MPTYKNIGRSTIIVDNLCNYRFEIGVETPTKYPHTPILHPDLEEVDVNPIYNPILAVHTPITTTVDEAYIIELNENTYQLEIWNDTNTYFYLYYNTEDNVPPTVIHKSISESTKLPIDKVSQIIMQFPSIISEGDVIISEIRRRKKII